MSYLIRLKEGLSAGAYIHFPAPEIYVKSPLHCIMWIINLYSSEQRREQMPKLQLVFRAPVINGVTTHATWVIRDAVRHIGSTLTKKTACELAFDTSEMEPTYHIGTVREIPLEGEEFCPVCREWIEQDWKRQKAAAG